jgi:para-aminobenzoate synthetase component 1
VILVEHGPGGEPAVFRNPHAVIAVRRARDLAAALARAEVARAQGAWLAGYVGYEAGYALEPRLAPLMPAARRAPLLLLGLYDGPQPAGETLAAMAAAGQGTTMSMPRPLISRAGYLRTVARVKDYIAAGDCYQVNLTFPLRARLLSGTPLRPVWRPAPQRAGRPWRLCRSRPGPGDRVAQPRTVLPARSGRPDRNPADEGHPPARPRSRPRCALAAALAADPKDRAENLMIVDLLRNDISRLARVGSGAGARALSPSRHYATVHQMTSTVEGRPCGPPTLPG